MLLVLKCDSVSAEDCRQYTGGPFYFKRVDDTHYQCVYGGPPFPCPDTFSIPQWYDYGSTQPCLCSIIPTEFNQTTLVCPQDPWLGRRTTEHPISATPAPGTVNDNGQSAFAVLLHCRFGTKENGLHVPVRHVPLLAP